MLKRAAAVLAAIMILSSVVFAADGDAPEYTEPTDEEKAALNEIVVNSFLITENFGDGVAPRDGDVFDYLLTVGEFSVGGAFAEYCTENDGTVAAYTIPFDLFMSVVEKHFTVYPDMKEYFGEDYNEADNTVHTAFVWNVDYGVVMEPERFVRVKDEYHVLGVALDPNFRDKVTDKMKPHDDYFPLIGEDGKMTPCYVDDCFDMIFEKNGDGFRFAGKRSLDYYMSDGKVYLRAGNSMPDVGMLSGIYCALTVNAAGVNVICEDAREFEFLPGLWVPESAEVTFSLHAEDGAEIKSVTYDDGSGTEKALTPDENGLYKVKAGESAVTLTVKTNLSDAEPPADTNAGAEPNDTNAPSAGDDTAAETKKSKPKKDKDTDEPEENESGCGAAMSVSAVVTASAAAAAAFAVSKRRH